MLLYVLFYFVAGVSMQMPITDNHADLTLNEKAEIHSDFYKLNYDNQSRFKNQQCPEIIDVKRQTTSQNILRRHVSVIYCLPLKSGKNMYMPRDIIIIPPCRLQILQEVFYFNLPIKDLRGKHSNMPYRIQSDIKKYIVIS